MTMLGELWNSFKSTLRGFDSPHQLALGLTLGICLGLIPKDSFIPYVIGLIGLLSTANLLCLGLGAVIASQFGPHLDGLAHEIGAWLLLNETLSGFWSAIGQLPLAEWTRLNNSVVTGQLALGLLAAVPIYLVTRVLAHRFGSLLYRSIANHRFTRRFFVQDQIQLQES